MQTVAIVALSIFGALALIMCYCFCSQSHSQEQNNTTRSSGTRSIFDSGYYTSYDCEHGGHHGHHDHHDSSGD